MTEADFNSLSPKNSVISFSDIPLDLKDYFLLNNSLYRKLLIDYLIKNTDIKSFDDNLQNSDLEYISILESDMDIYQYLSSDNFKYIYLRNNIYLEALTDEERNILGEKIESQNYNLDEVAEKLIKDSFQRVIFEDKLGDGSISRSIFSSKSTSYKAPNNALVFGIRFDIFNLNGMTSKEWDELHQKQMRNLFEVSNKLKETLSASLAIPVEALIYSEYSITPRDAITHEEENQEKFITHAGEMNLLDDDGNIVPQEKVEEFLAKKKAEYEAIPKRGKIDFLPVNSLVKLQGINQFVIISSLFQFKDGELYDYYGFEYVDNLPQENKPHYFNHEQVEHNTTYFGGD